MAYHLKLSCTKKLSLDCKTRWNSTYFMLVTAIEYRYVFPRLKLKDRHYSSLLSDQEWNMAKTICENLKIFYDLTNLISGTKYPIANVYFVEIYRIRQVLNEWTQSSTEIIRDMTSNMFNKFQKY